MIKILIDTMHIHDLLIEEEEEGPYFKLAEKIKDQKITGVISAVTLTELIIHLGKDIYRPKIKELVSTNLVILDVNQGIAIRAGELHMNQKLPLGDPLELTAVELAFLQNEGFDKILPSAICLKPFQ